MATVRAARASTTAALSSRPGLNFTYGVYELVTNLAAATIIEFCRVPQGAIVVDGFIRGDDLDVGTEELDFDIGYAANGAVAGDPDAFGNFGVTAGDAVVDIKPEAQIWMPLNGTLKDGPVTFTRETVIQAVINVDSADTGTGTLYLGIYYLDAMRDLQEFYVDVLGELGVTGPDRAAAGEDTTLVESKYPMIWGLLNGESLTSWNATDDIPDEVAIALAWIVAFNLCETFGVYGQKRESLRLLGQVGGDKPSLGEQILRRQASVDYIPSTLEGQYF